SCVGVGENSLNHTLLILYPLDIISSQGYIRMVNSSLNVDRSVIPGCQGSFFYGFGKSRMSVRHPSDVLRRSSKFHSRDSFCDNISGPGTYHMETQNFIRGFVN